MFDIIESDKRLCARSNVTPLPYTCSIQLIKGSASISQVLGLCQAEHKAVICRYSGEKNYLTCTNTWEAKAVVRACSLTDEGYAHKSFHKQSGAA